MLKILTGADRNYEPELFRQMFAGRAEAFHNRLGWKVVVENGLEIDRYDREDDTVYLLSVDESGRVAGSLRLLPTTGETMLKNEFSDFFDEPVDVVSPTIWECTRFCVPAPKTPAGLRSVRASSSELLIGLCELCLDSGVEHVVGIVYAHSLGIYRRRGWAPDVLATARDDGGQLVAGLWEASGAVLADMRAIASRAADRVEAASSPLRLAA